MNQVTNHVLVTGNELVIVKDDVEQHRFSLNAIRPGDLNSGYIDGTLADGEGPQTWTSTQATIHCRLTFTPLGHGKLEVIQDLRFGDCGFGYGVVASGRYVRTREHGKLGSWNGP